MGINDTWYLSCPESPNSLIFTKFCRLHVMARPGESCYETSDKVMTKNGYTVAIVKSTNMIKLVTRNTLEHHNTSGTRLI